MLVKELIELLKKCPQEDVLLADTGGEEAADVTDVLVGNGTIKGFSYIKIEPYNPAEIIPDWKTHVTDRFSRVN